LDTETVTTYAHSLLRKVNWTSADLSLVISETPSQVCGLHEHSVK